jgi:hypothetical protein
MSRKTEVHFKSNEASFSCERRAHSKFIAKTIWFACKLTAIRSSIGLIRSASGWRHRKSAPVCGTTPPRRRRGQTGMSVIHTVSISAKTANT